MRSFARAPAWLAVAAGVFAALSAGAAEFKSNASPLCKISLEGAIHEGDASHLEALMASIAPAEADQPVALTLCLNSSGGNYDEGLKLISLLLKRANVATVVERGAQCYSACAFVFLAGNTQISEDGELGPDRTLDAGGILGFHAPYLKAGTEAADPVATAETFRQGVHAIAKMLEIDRRNLFPRGLLARALQVAPDYLLYVDTIEKAGVWSIKLKGYRAPPALTDAMLDQACRNKDIWTNYAHSFLSRPAGDPDPLHGIGPADFPQVRGSADPIRLNGGKYRVVPNDEFGLDATNGCTADVFKDNKKQLYVSLALASADQPTSDPNQFAKDVAASVNDPQTLEHYADPLWYVYPPQTTLKSIALP